MSHIVDDDDCNTLCGTKISDLDDGPESLSSLPVAYLGEMIRRDDVTRNCGEDEFHGTCHNCIRIAKSRMKKGWLPAVSDGLTRENCYF